MGDNGAKYLGEGIERCVNLTSLNLNLKDNSFGDKGAKFFGEGIARNVTLTSLNLNLESNSIGHNVNRILE